MLQSILKEGSINAIELIARQWDTEASTVATDLRRFLTKLVQKKILVRAEQSNSGLRPSLRVKCLRKGLSLLIRGAYRWRGSLRQKADRLLLLGNLSCRWLGWAHTIELWENLFKKASLPKNSSENSNYDSSENSFEQLDYSIRAAIAQSAFTYACKERGLVSWALARSLGLTPQLKIGVSLSPLSIHCWTQLGPRCFADDQERCAQYEPILTYT